MLQAAPFLGARVLDPVGQHPGVTPSSWTRCQISSCAPRLACRAAQGTSRRAVSSRTAASTAGGWWPVCPRVMCTSSCVSVQRRSVVVRWVSSQLVVPSVQPERRSRGDRVHVDAWLNHRSPGIDMYSNLRWAGDRHKDGPAPLRCGAIAAALGGGLLLQLGTRRGARSGGHVAAAVILHDDLAVVDDLAGHCVVVAHCG